ncbi:hypothetical protein SFA35_12360 [Pseudomonas sp. HR96]|uniref:hypothetical protein n=1 Tax=Pseudomonas sp. HR96 TaxID=1027966 RepID=UPI002A74C64D|nr:hypothetical protein [Pseudomonas sp. HR96]WPP02095.1 hypothetical protein SFA35_12360 [Pseudomonas sp. HR96]
MHIIEKTGAPVRSLTPAEQSLLEGFVQNRLENVRLLQANQWLLKLRGEGQWLACDCQPQRRPVLNVTLNSDTGTLFLKNNPGTPDHAPDCPFTKDLREPGERHTQAHEAPASWLAPDRPLRLLGEFSAASVASTGETSTLADQSREPHRLLSLLLTLVEASALNVYATAGKRDLSAQFAALRDAAARYPLIDRVPASHYLQTRLDIKHMMMLKARLQGSEAFGEQRRHGLLLDCVTEVRARKVITEPQPAGFDFQGHHSLWGGARTPGPLLALALYSTTQAHRQFYEMIHLATLPVLSRAQLFPVFRDDEREPLKMLVGLIDWMAGKGVKVTMRRPVIGAAVMDELVLSATGDRILSVSLTQSPQGPEPSSETFKRLADFKSLETFKRFVAGFFMRQG